MIDCAFWRGRRVFLTGHTGFKGAWLALWLQRLGAQVIGYSIDIPSQPSFFNVSRISAGMRDRRGDVNDLSALTEAMTGADPEILIHAAAQSLVRRSYSDPVGTFRTNVIGTANVLQSARSVKSLKVVVIVTSDKCYENRESVVGYRETDALGGHDPYSASKGAAEIVTASMRRSFFNPESYRDHGVAVATVRAGNVIGGGDWSSDRLVPDLMRGFSNGAPVTIRNPHAVRPWQFVLDPLAGYLLLCEHLWSDGPQFAEGWNFGPGRKSEQPVSALVEKARHLWPGNTVIKVAEEAALHESTLLRLDTAKARNRLGWRSKADFETAIRLTIEWYRAYYAGNDARAIAEKQLGEWDDFYKRVPASCY